MNTSYDIVVVGSGSAGSVAAIAAALQGKKVLLVERYGFLGGTSTGVLDSFYGFFIPGATSRRVVGGIAWDVVEALEAEDAMMYRPSTYGAGTAVTYNAEILKCVWDRLVTEAGVSVLFHALCTGVIYENDSWTLTISTKTEPLTIHTKWIIDASGDAQISTWAGAQSEPIDVEKLQSLTTTFRVVNVDATQANEVKHAKLVELMELAQSQGFQLPRRDGSIHITPIEGSYVANMSRVTKTNPLIPSALSAAEIQGREQALRYYRFLREYVPGYQNAELVWLSTHIGVRESRRVLGEYTLTRNDVLNATKFKDSIGQSGAPVEDHNSSHGTVWEYLPENKTVDIPYRSLIPKGVRKLLVAGRCLSASHDAHAAVRSMAQCMVMGQAAGTAASLCIDDGVESIDLDTSKLQSVLQHAGVIL